jgi:uncharacterized protein (TIGR00251 family)
MRITVRVVPRSSRNTLAWEPEHPDTLKVHLTAPPVEGAANTALIALLATQLAIPRRSIAIVRGITGRQKVVEIADMDLEEFSRRIKPR